MANSFVVGLVKGRHDMPADIEDYVFNEPVVDPTDVDGLFNASLGFIQRAISDPAETRLVIYVTGLTPALIATLNAAQCIGVRLIVCRHWNRETGTYFNQLVF